MVRNIAVLGVLSAVLLGLYVLLGPGAQRPSPEQAASSEGKARVQRKQGALQAAQPVLPRSERSTQLEASEPATQAEPTRADARFVDALGLLRRLLPDDFQEHDPEDLERLFELDLQGTQITDKELSILGALIRLESLGLRGTKVTDAGLIALGDMQRLTHLDLSHTTIEGTGLFNLQLHNLKSLQLGGTNFGSDELYRLPRMPKLETLKLNSLEIDDEALRVLGRFPKLWSLELDRTGITSQGLEYLMAENPKLARVELRGTSLDEASLARLRLAYPRCNFVYEAPKLPAALRGG